MAALLNHGSMRAAADRCADQGERAVWLELARRAELKTFGDKIAEHESASVALVDRVIGRLSVAVIVVAVVAAIHNAVVVLL